MAKILVVDDSAVARHTIAKILREHEDYEVLTAGDGEAALIEVEMSEPSIVVTDLVMPKMNGFELVARLRVEHPHVPAVLITSEGSEDIASQALREGAASYVPKSMLEQDLLLTVQRILGLATQERSRLSLLSRLRATDMYFELENDPALVPALIQHLQDCMQQMGHVTEADLIRISVALEEALANAVYHGNLEVDSALKNEPDDAFYKVAQQRREEPPYNERYVRVTATLNPEHARFVIEDDGKGFDLAKLPDPTDTANLDKLSGRGVMLMQSFLDEVRYNDSGNQVTLVKRCGDSAE